jgi:hypothetical protein
MTDQETWQEKMLSIYQGFDDARKKIETEGMKPDSVVTEKKGAYIIALNPQPLMLKQIAIFAERLREVAYGRLVAYDWRDMHTTLSDYKLAANFEPDESPDHEQILDKLSLIANRARSIRQYVHCAYEGGAVFNQSTGLVKGIPNEAFYVYAQAVIEEGRKSGLELRMPWGAQITFARVKEEIPAETALKLLDLCKGSNFSQTLRYGSIDVGWFTAGPEDGFNMNWVARYPLFDR